MKNLLERYIDEVGKHLPGKSRADIQTEIRSTLEDMLEEQADRAGHPVDDAMIQDLLRSYGAPAKVAESYQPDRYLIGPKMFPIFTLVLKIVMAVLSVLAVVGFGVRFGLGELSLAAFGTQLAKSAMEYFGGILSAFGNIVFIFAILERTLPKSEYENELEENGWDPAELLNDPEPDEFHAWEPIVTIVFSVLGLSILNFYPQFFGFYAVVGSVNLFIPSLSDAFFRMLLWINTACVLGILLNILLLRSGRWTPVLRWFEIGLKIIGIWIAAILLKGPSILVFDPDMLAKSSMEASMAGTLVGIFSQMASIGLAVAVIVGGVEVVLSVYRILFKRRRAAPIVIK